MTLSPETRAKAKRKADWRGFLLRCLSLIALLAATVGVATLIAQWAGAHRPIGRLQTVEGRS